MLYPKSVIELRLVYSRSKSICNDYNHFQYAVDHGPTAIAGGSACCNNQHTYLLTLKNTKGEIRKKGT